MSNKDKFKGILVPIISPLTADGGVDLDAFERVIRYDFEKGADGLYVGGATGDGYYLRLEERKQTAEVAARLCKEYGRLCVMHCGAQSTRDALELVKYGVSLGVDAISAMPPVRSNAIQRRNYYEALTEAAGSTPFLIYYIPALAVSIPLEELVELLSLKNVIGLKFSDANFFYMKRLLIHKPDIVIFNGEDELLTYGLLAGADGGIGMNYNVFPDLFVGIYQCVNKGDIQNAMKLQNALAEFLDPVFKAGLYEAVEYSVQLRFGMDMRCFRGPNSVRVLTDAEKAAIKEKMEALDRVIAEVMR